MFYVYVTQSQKDKGLYIGFTSDLKKRMKEHNTGKTKSIKHRIPFKLVYYEAYLNKTDARKREIEFIKYLSTISDNFIIRARKFAKKLCGSGYLYPLGQKKICQL